MKQEDYNEMMRNPDEKINESQIAWKKCPSCGFNYCGNGIDTCIECITGLNKGKDNAQHS